MRVWYDSRCWHLSHFCTVLFGQINNLHRGLRCVVHRGDKTGAHSHIQASYVPTRLRGRPPRPAGDPVWTLSRCPLLGCHLAEAVTKVLRAGPWVGEAAHRLTTLETDTCPPELASCTSAALRVTVPCFVQENVGPASFSITCFIRS